MAALFLPESKGLAYLFVEEVEGLHIVWSVRVLVLQLEEQLLAVGFVVWLGVREFGGGRG